MPYIVIFNIEISVSSAVTEREILCPGKQEKQSKFYNEFSVNFCKSNLRNPRKIALTKSLWQEFYSFIEPS